MLKFDMKIFVNVARLEIGQLFTQGTRLGHPCTLETFPVIILLVTFMQVLRSFNIISLISSRVSQVCGADNYPIITSASKT